jgi:hypothetical protein
VERMRIALHHDPSGANQHHHLKGASTKETAARLSEILTMQKELEVRASFPCWARQICTGQSELLYVLNKCVCHPFHVGHMKYAQDNRNCQLCFINVYVCVCVMFSVLDMQNMHKTFRTLKCA